MPTPVYHPMSDDDGLPVVIESPSVSSVPETWLDPQATAVVSVLDAAALPCALNGLAFSPAAAPDDWTRLNDGVFVEEPPYRTDLGLRLTSGCVVLEPDGRVWLVHPTNRYGNVHVTFPKGRHEPDLTLLVNAIKETLEESGLAVEPLAYLCDIVRTKTVTRYYVVRRIGGTPANAGWESQAVSLVPATRLEEALDRPNDRKVLPYLNAWLSEHPRD